MKEVLLVEDDATLADVLDMHLAAEGYLVRRAVDGEQALEACAASRPEVVLLDVMLPRRNGLEVCTELRRRYGQTPGVVMLTALGSEVDVVCGLDAGADDYVVKPIRPKELLARVRSVARRLGVDATSRELSFGPLVLDVASRAMTVSGQPVRLTATEYELLVCLACAPGRVWSRRELLERVFDTTHTGYARNVDCHVTRVRRKLEVAGLAVSPIETVHGAGYRFTPPC